MQQFHQFLEFLDRHFIWLFLFSFAWVVIAFTWRYYRHKRSGIVFPDVGSEQVRFHEGAASGWSHKTMFTRLGGARNCLQVTVTDTEVWIRPFFPFSILSRDFDLEHRIARSSITCVQPSQSTFARPLLLDYRDDRGKAHRLSLLLRKPDDFLRALDLQNADK